MSNFVMIETLNLINSVWINRFYFEIFEKELILFLNVFILNISGLRK